MRHGSDATGGASPAGRGRRRGGTGALLILLAGLALQAAPASGQSADDPPGRTRPTQVPPGYLYSGELTCVIGGGLTPLLGADRDLSCTFDRHAAVSERYEGLSGIVTGRTREPQAVVFAVWMPRPDALAALAGDFNGTRVSPAGDGALFGGLDDAVVLTPLVGRAATDLEALNALLRLNQLHLNYGGRVPRGVGRGGSR